MSGSGQTARARSERQRRASAAPTILGALAAAALVTLLVRRPSRGKTGTATQAAAPGANGEHAPARAGEPDARTSVSQPGVNGEYAPARTGEPDARTSVSSLGMSGEHTPARAGEPVATRRGRLVRAICWLPALLAVLVAAAFGAWLLDGGHVIVMQTPSMGTVAPTGSLVLTRPVGSQALHRGMLIAFRVPGSGELYMHRIAQIERGGLIRTRGDLDSSNDAWALARSSIVGVPALIVPGIGWLLLAAPWAIAALALGFLLARFAPRPWRASLRAASFGVAIALPLLILKPFVRVTVTVAGRARGEFFAHVVNGGLFPLNVALGTTHVHLNPGHATTILAAAGARTHAHLSAHAAIPLAGWALIALLVLVPALAGTLGASTGSPPSSPPLRSRRGRSRARRPLVAASSHQVVV
jgi:hypothetical protein